MKTKKTKVVEVINRNESELNQISAKNAESVKNATSEEKKASAKENTKENNANNEESTNKVESFVFDTLSKVCEGLELESFISSISLKNLKAYYANVTGDEILKVYAKRNNNIYQRNFTKVYNAFYAIVEDLKTAGKLQFLDVELTSFFEKLATVEKDTENFKITFQSENSENTIGYYDSIVPQRLTTATASGFRICFNSIRNIAECKRIASEKQRLSSDLQALCEKYNISYDVAITMPVAVLKSMINTL